MNSVDRCVVVEIRAEPLLKAVQGGLRVPLETRKVSRAATKHFQQQNNTMMFLAQSHEGLNTKISVKIKGKKQFVIRLHSDVEK